MRVFDHPNFTSGWKCPVCGLADDKPVVLIAIAGTEDGHTAQADQFHLECLELQYHRELNGITQAW